mmetsp:Transcript_1320/g.1794  ORF Transcript_1320/g.1794 Transcript_1320/m.1794 type:complete len:124 (+) Transcript_1320:405-776(+)|eukprot:CAMPEP_0185576620 /NCGR_PEP_ID=MMETSP0434-20130131/7495_1 /TAXON_ID=626734 ORGANISM="Favella taraikaensis, Strain Fe Narragansett Bay" /NCGR_SAMPLE_ID=MMETSP0434 /ASSEMBLY_ACC=CAM_ASM_000379 /LENGTH=123 /DNA_ID=CAMNT_0028193893 /DNA_START=407 /DNA_END=778 /DNA_ORIENTATION=+
MQAIDNFLAKRREPENDSFTAAAEEAVEKPKHTSLAKQSDDALSEKTASTHFSSDIVSQMKKRKTLLTQATDEMSPSERATFYSSLVFNQVHSKADRVLQKCDETCDKVTQLASRNQHLIGCT